MMRALLLLGLIATTLLGVTACGTSGEGETERFAPLPKRPGTIVVESCTLDAFQSSALEQPAVKQVARAVVFVCPVIHGDGSVAPEDPEATQVLVRAVARAKSLGYSAHVAVTMGDDRGTFPAPLSHERAHQVLATPEWRKSIVDQLQRFAEPADGLELYFLDLPDESKGDLTAFVSELDAAYRPRKSLGVMAPPKVREPSDTLGGEAWDLKAIAPHVDRVRMMTLDFSCCATGPGPGLDSGWAVDVARHARGLAQGVPVDISVPLYGTDFSDLGTRFVDFTDGRALAASFDATTDRALGDELHFGYTDGAGHIHEVYFPDALATSRALRAWGQDTLPLDVGVLFYGLGSEDPALWGTISRGAP